MKQEITIDQFNKVKGGTNRKTFFKNLFLGLVGFSVIDFSRKAKIKTKSGTLLTKFEINKNLLIPCHDGYEVNQYGEYVQVVATVNDSKGRFKFRVRSNIFPEVDLEKRWKSECDILESIARRSIALNERALIDQFEYPNHISQCSKIS